LTRSRYCPSPDDPPDLISSSDSPGTSLSVEEGPFDTELLALWIAELDGVPSLFSWRGSTPSCEVYGLHHQSPLLLAPGGVPPNTLEIWNTCSNEELADFDFQIQFDETLDHALTWDPLQTHPAISGTTDSQGRATVVLRGGGCSRSGEANLRCSSGAIVGRWHGAKSPDLDGDCGVGEDDLAQVRAALGTDDFCADLDGSGLVDQADVAMVESALGTLCTGVVTVESESAVGPLRLQIEPNPCRERADLILRNATGAERIRIFDINGRLVRDFGMVAASRGSARMEWNLRDAIGRPVSSGLYVVAAVGGTSATRRSILVLN
jgi:hypothetical protein